MTTRLLYLLLFIPTLAFGQIQYASSNGFSFKNPVYSTSTSISAPASSELATAGWVRSLFDGFGASYYVTTNINNTFTNSDIVTTNTAVYEFNASIPVYDRRVYTVPTNNCYIGQVTTTNKFQQLLAGVVVNSYLEAQNGSGTGGPQIKPEIYVSYDRTNWIGDWDAQPQYIPEGATNLISWVVANPTYVSTNAAGFYVQRRFKMVTQTSPTLSDVILHLGTNRPSHIALNGDVGTIGNAYLAANQTFTGSNTFYNLTVTSNLTLAGNLNVATLVATNVAGNGAGLTNLSSVLVGGVGGTIPVSFSNSRTRYTAFGWTIDTATEAVASVPLEFNSSTPITLSALSLRSNALGTGTNMVVTLMTNGIASSVTCSIGGNGAVQYASDLVNSVTVTNGSTISLRFTGDNPSQAAGNCGYSIKVTR